MSLPRAGYSRALGAGQLSLRSLNRIERHLERHLTLEVLPDSVLKGSNGGAKITALLSRLHLRVARHSSDSWEGLVVGFPGTAAQLSTDFMGTPYLRKILYPILDLHRRLQDHYSSRLPCLYLLGHRFPDVLLRKFSLLESVTQHVIVLTNDLTQKYGSRALELPTSIHNEYDAQAFLCREMSANAGMTISAGNGRSLQLKYLAHEVACREGTRQPERLDILAVNQQDKALVAFELKGPGASRLEVENLFLQGIEHLQWLEANKMAVKLIFEGPRGRQINTRKRSRLVLGLFQANVPTLFSELRERAGKRDRHLRIDFVSLQDDTNGGITATLL